MISILLDIRTDVENSRIEIILNDMICFQKRASKHCGANINTFGKWYIYIKKKKLRFENSQWKVLFDYDNYDYICHLDGIPTRNTWRTPLVHAR